MIRKKLTNKKEPQSIFQWNDKGGEYEVKCPRCKQELSAPTLNTIKRSFNSHYRTKQCKAHY